MNVTLWTIVLLQAIGLLWMWRRLALRGAGGERCETDGTVSPDRDSLAETRRLLETAETKRLGPEEVRDVWKSADGVIGDNYADVLFDHDFVLNQILLCLRDRDPNIGLDLGCGSGRVAKILLQEFPMLRLTLVDISPNLLKVASSQLAEHSSRLTFVEADFFSNAFQLEAQRYDFVVSAFALHHGPDVACYREVFQKIESSLAAGGVFLCWDHVQGADADLETLNFDSWRHHFLRSGSMDEAADQIKSSYAQDSPLTSAQYLETLAACGFTTADILWKKGNMILYVAIK